MSFFPFLLLKFDKYSQTGIQEDKKNILQYRKIGKYWRMFITLEHNSISQRLVGYRQQLGKSQAEMSREFGVNQSHYSKLESGTKYISYSSLKKFEEAGGDVNYLITGVHYKTGIVEDCMERCKTSDGKVEIMKALFWLTRQGIILMHGENWRETNQRVQKYIRLAEEKEQQTNIWKIIRKIEDLTQMKMAERLDINIKRYQRLERMEAEPDAVILNSLYTLFGYSPLIILHENLYYAEEINKCWSEFPDEVKEQLSAVLEEDLKLITLCEQETNTALQKN